MGSGAVGRLGSGAVRLMAFYCPTAMLCPTALTAQNRPCQLQLIGETTRQFVRTQVTPTTENYFAGGSPIQLRCRGQNVRIWTDSIASYQGQVVQFIGNFRYEDETARVRADFGTYVQVDERWEARGNVQYTNIRDGSRLEGPSVNYNRRVQGLRSLEEVFADQRPRLTLTVREERARTNEPYVIVADRLRLQGQNRMWAGGTVTIDRSDLRGRSDSLELDTSPIGSGKLVGSASIRRTAQDTFALAGKRIDLTLANRELTSVTGRDTSSLTSRNLELKAEAIRLRLDAQRVVQTTAWGNQPRPAAVVEDYLIRGDSLIVDSPGETLRGFQSYGRAWVGLRPDTVQGERDWISGDSVRAEFVPRDTAAPGQRRSVLRRLEARHQAASFYRVTVQNAPGGRPSINYSRADRIVLFMQPGDSVKVERVEMWGKVDGIQLEPAAARSDTTRRPGPSTPPPVRRP